MVLFKQNCGKYLTKEWHDPDRERQQCLYDQRDFTTAERALYEVTGTGITDGLGYQTETFVTETAPIDTNTTSQPMDIRNRPEVGN